MKKLFDPIKAAEWPAINAEIERQNENGADTSTIAA